MNWSVGIQRTESGVARGSVRRLVREGQQEARIAVRELARQERVQRRQNAVEGASRLGRRTADE